MEDREKVVVAKTAGFCFGVKRAMEIVYEQIALAEEGKVRRPIYTYGPIIHNEQVVAELEKRDVYVADAEHPDAIAEGTMVIRSHGISRAEQEALMNRGLELVDVTCPFVKKIHRIVEKATAEGRAVIIIGDPSHPEVQGIRGWCVPGSEDRCFVVKSADDIERLPELTDVTVVCQTTFNHNLFEEHLEKIQKRIYNTFVVNTICNATQERQIEALKLAEEMGTMIVIGGKNSSNTQKLFDICRSACPNTYYIQTPVDLGTQGFTPVRSVGITAGASTPNNIIEEVHTYVRSKL